MRCTNCHADEFDRVLLDLHADSVVGGLCEGCERGLRTGSVPLEAVVDAPVVEEAEPRFAAPRLDLVVSDPDGGDLYLEYTFDPQTPTLRELRPADEEATAERRQSA